MNPKREGIFISYARKDGEPTAVGLRQLLTGESFNVWRDRDSLAGGSGWWVQITEALDSVQFMLLVLTPGAIASDIVRKEWRYARQQGVCVYLVKGTADLEFKTLPRWMSDQQIYDWFDPLEQQKLVNDLKKTPDLKRVPFMADDLPKDFVPRPGEFDQLIGHLLAETREDPVAITAALRGAGGYGKTTLAKALCHDERIQDAFDDGILWVTLGETPGDLNAKVLELIEVLCGYKPDYTGAEAIAARFRELLADRDILLVIDDVWNHAHLRPFLQGGERCARLITTRNPKTLPDAVAEVPVDAMLESEAVALLSAGLAVGGNGENVRSPGFSRKDSAAKPLPPEGGTTNALRKLAARLGEWPLLLRLANGVLRTRTKSGESLAAAITYANRALDKRGLKAFDANNPLERNQAVSATLAVSLDQISDEDRARFFELAIFPEDIYVPMVTLERYWRLDDMDTDDLCDRLYHASLLLEFDLGTRVIRLHDVIRTFLRDERKADLAALNAQLLDAHRPAAGWGELADDEPYFWDYLAEHLVEADCGEELVATVKDWRYLAKKTLLRKSPSVEKDLIKGQMLAPADEVLRTLTRSFANTGHLFNRCQTWNDLESTMYIRLQHLPQLKQDLLGLVTQSSKRPYITKQCELPDLPHPAMIRKLEGHSDFIWDCAFSPDGALIVTASSDHTLKIWDSLTGQLLRTLDGHSDDVRSCLFSPDGELLVSGSDDGTLKIWDTKKGQMLNTLEGHWPPVSSCAFSPDSRFIVSGGGGGILVWDVMTGEMLRTLEENLGITYIKGCAFSPDGKMIVSASSDGTLKIWDASTCQLIWATEPREDAMEYCAFSPDSKLVFSAYFSDRSIYVRDVATGRLSGSIKLNDYIGHGFAFSPDGKTMVTANFQNTLKFWDIETRQLLGTVESDSDNGSGVAFSPDGKLLASASGASLVIWDAATDGQILEDWQGQHSSLARQIYGNAPSVRSCVFTPSGNMVILTYTYPNNSLVILSALTGKKLFQYLHDGIKCCVATLSNDLHVLKQFGGTFIVEDGISKRELYTFKLATTSFEHYVFSPNGRMLALASSDHTLQIRNIWSERLLHSLQGHISLIRHCVFSTDGTLLVSASNDRTLKIWNVLTGELLQNLTGHSDSIESCGLSSDGKLIVSASSDETLKVWETGTEQALRTFKGHSGRVNACAFSPDGKQIVSASDDKTLKVWDADSGECLTTFFADGPLNCCAMHGDLIVAGGARGVYFLKLVR